MLTCLGSCEVESSEVPLKSSVVLVTSPSVIRWQRPPTTRWRRRSVVSPSAVQWQRRPLGDPHPVSGRSLAGGLSDEISPSPSFPSSVASAFAAVWLSRPPPSSLSSTATRATDPTCRHNVGHPFHRGPTNCDYTLKDGLHRWNDWYRQVGIYYLSDRAKIRSFYR